MESANPISRQDYYYEQRIYDAKEVSEYLWVSPSTFDRLINIHEKESSLLWLPLLLELATAWTATACYCPITSVLLSWGYLTDKASISLYSQCSGVPSTLVPPSEIVPPAGAQVASTLADGSRFQAGYWGAGKLEGIKLAFVRLNAAAICEFPRHLSMIYRSHGCQQGNHKQHRELKWTNF